MNLPSAELQSPATAAGSNTPRDVHTNKPPPSPKQLIRPNNAVTKGVDRAILFTVRDLVDGNDHQVYSVTKMCLPQRGVLKDEGERARGGSVSKKWNIFDVWQESNNLRT